MKPANSIRVKICGITSVEDAQTAVRFGADAIGVVFADSPRKVSLSDARRICRAASPFVTTLGVFVNASAAQMARTAARVGLSGVQLHGEEPASTARKLRGLCRIKAFKTAGGLFSVQVMESYPAEWVLLDSGANRLRGGSGISWDWSLAQDLKLGKPWILAGGLSPVNVASAVKLLHPSAVDISSGIEISPGKKDPRKMEAFIRSVQSINTRERRP